MQSIGIGAPDNVLMLNRCQDSNLIDSVFALSRLEFTNIHFFDSITARKRIKEKVNQQKIQRMRKLACKKTY